MVHANPMSVPAAPKPPSVCANCTVTAPEFDLATVSGGLAAFVGAGWLLLGWRRNSQRLVGPIVSPATTVDLQQRDTSAFSAARKSAIRCQPRHKSVFQTRVAKRRSFAEGLSAC
jgi:hypothetical protein